MEDQYGMADLRQYMTGTAFYPPFTRPPPPPPPPPDVLSSHRGLTSRQYPYDMLVFQPDSAVIGPSSVVTTANTSSAAAAGGGFETDCGGGGVVIGFSGAGDGGTGRWPRQETLALLEIRSKLDGKFKEANQKGPLWDEVSRIMSEEHGYQRTGKKCREKFENLYKYYKKTKEGKAGRQDGKHYRFFRQLEALYGENNSNLAENHFGGSDFHHNFPNNNVNLADNRESYPGSKLSDTSLMSVSTSSGHDNSDTTSSDDTNDPKKKKRRGRRTLKAKIKDFIDSHMRKLAEKQEAWMEKMTSMIENKEQERMLREEQWRKQDADRMERQQTLWASERAWMEARDAALMEAFRKLTRNESTELVLRNDHQIWPESEITRLIQLRTQTEMKFRENQENGISEEALWEEIASRMACFGHERSALMCSEKWDSVNNYLLKCNKKRRENNDSTIYDHHHQGVAANYCGTNEQGINDQNASSYPINDGFFRYNYGRIMN